MYKIGLKLWSINTDYYYEEAKRLYDNGVFDYIELYVVPDTLDKLDIWKKLNIPFILHCPHFMHGFNMAKFEKKECNFTIYQQVKRFADELNAEFIIFHGGVDGNIEETAHIVDNTGGVLEKNGDKMENYTSFFFSPPRILKASNALPKLNNLTY